MIEQEEPYESRGSRTVLWERWGETPRRDPTIGNATNERNEQTRTKQNE